MVHFKSTSGFSILEVLITTAIIGIITSIIIFQYGSFNNVVLLKSQAYEIALDLREAQTYAVSVLYGSSGSSRQDYGIYFNINNPNLYIVFLDQDDQVESGVEVDYDVGEEIGQPRTLDARFQIHRLCVNNCLVDVEDLSISFKRPDFDGQFSSVDARENSGVTSIYDADIVIKNVIGTLSTRTVKVLTTGQIDVE